MKKQRPEYEALVPRIANGELTRKQAAEISATQTGLSEGSFLVWLSASGSTKALRHNRLNAGDTSVRALVNTDPDKAKAYDDAIKAVTEGRMNAEVAAKKFGVSYQYMMRKIKTAKDAAKPVENKTQVLEDIATALDIDPAKVLALAKAMKDLGI